MYIHLQNQNNNIFKQLKKSDTMKKQIKLTEEHNKALVLINEAIEFGADIWSHPKGARGGKNDLDNCCEYCGKFSKDGDGDSFQILTSGIIIPNSIDELLVWDLYNAKLIYDQPQGSFSIGSTCAKNLLKNKLSLYK